MTHTDFPHTIGFDTQDGRRTLIVDAQGNLIRPPDDLTVVGFQADGRGGYIAAACHGHGKYGYMDHAGQWVIPPSLDDAMGFTRDGLARCRAGGLWGYVDRTGKWVIPPSFAAAEPFSEGLAAVKRPTDTHFGYIDASGAIVIAPQYEEASPFSAGLAGVRPQRDGRIGYIDRQGAMVIEPAFDRVYPFSPDGVAPVACGNGEHRLIDRDGRPVSTTTFFYLEPFNSLGLAYFCSADRDGYGYIDTSGRIVIEGSPSEACGAGLIKASDVGGFLNRNGETVIERTFEWVDDFDDCGATLAYQYGEWFILQNNGDLHTLPGLEPLTDDEGWVIGFHDGNNLAPFLDEAGDTLYLNAKGNVVCRLRFQQGNDRSGRRLQIENAAGETVWTSEARDCIGGRHFFRRRPGAHFEGLNWPKDSIVELARQLLQQAPRPFYPYSPVSDGDEDCYDIDEAWRHPVKTGAVARLASSYIDESHHGYYEFLSGLELEAFDRYYLALSEDLIAHFGQPVPGLRICLKYGDGYDSKVWMQGDRCLVLHSCFRCGDGDVEIELWLAAGTREGLER